MLSVKTFEGRVNEVTSQLGLKEEYRALYTDGSHTVSMTFGLDRAFSLTKPAIYTKNGFVPLSHSLNIGRNDTLQDSVAKYLSTKRGIYSVMSATMLICVLHGKIVGDKWANVSCEFYAPLEISGTSVSALRVTSTKIANCYTLQVIDKVREKICREVVRSCGTREEFLVSRMVC